MDCSKLSIAAAVVQTVIDGAVGTCRKQGKHQQIGSHNYVVYCHMKCNDDHFLCRLHTSNEYHYTAVSTLSYSFSLCLIAFTEH